MLISDWAKSKTVEQNGGNVRCAGWFQLVSATLHIEKRFKRGVGVFTRQHR
jgi:hypothetical protein